MEQKCIFKSSIWKVFEIFVDDPLKIHYIKEISKKINLAPTSVKIHLNILIDQNILLKKKGERFYGFIANRDNEDFIFYKKIFNLIKIKESGLVNEIVKNFYPKAIVLYGSYLRGEDIVESDVDLLVISKSKKNINFEKFEGMLKRRVHVIIEDNFKKFNEGLRLEIVNGYVLYGYLKNE